MRQTSNRQSRCNWTVANQCNNFQSSDHCVTFYTHSVVRYPFACVKKIVFLNVTFVEYKKRSQHGTYSGIRCGHTDTQLSVGILLGDRDEKEEYTLNSPTFRISENLFENLKRNYSSFSHFNWFQKFSELLF